MTTIPVPTDRQVRRVTRDHVAAMRVLHAAVQRVAVTSAVLVETMERVPGVPFAGGGLFGRVDTAIGGLGHAYEVLATVFDDPAPPDTPPTP